MRMTTERRVERGHLRVALAAALVLLALAATTLVAQEVPERLTLDDAIRLATGHNPDYLSTKNDEGVADWRVREAYGRFLPTANAGFAGAYTQAGRQQIGTLDFGIQKTDWYSSRYSLGLSWTLDGSTIFGLSNARAQRKATDARIDAAEFNLESQVALQYTAALRAQDGVKVAQRRVDRARQNARIVDSRVSSGAAAGIDGKRAEVDLGNAQVALIQAQLTLGDAKRSLGQQIGAPLGDSVELASHFEVFQPSWSLDSLLSEALTSHPALRAAEAAKDASVAGARQARSAYFPTLQVSTGFYGNTLQALNKDFVVNSAMSSVQSQKDNCQLMNSISSGLAEPLSGYPKDCSVYQFTAQDRRQVLAANSVFPFDFTKQPLQLSLSVSIPVFTGFSRQRQVAEAAAAADDARQSLRAEKLKLRTDVGQAFDALDAAYRVVQLQKHNQEVAAEELELQQKRYALGAVALLDLLDAQTTVSTADQSYLNALYDFHYNLIRLEASVGRPLWAR